MKKILNWNRFSGRLNSPVALLLVVAVSLAVVAIAFGDAEALKKKKSKGNGYLGISMQTLTEDLIEGMDLKVKRGVLVNEVFDDSPAEEAGIEDGDIIIEYEGVRIDSPDELAKLVKKTAVGKDVDLVLIRDDDKKKLVVTIGERPEEFVFSVLEGDVKPLSFVKMFTSKPKLGVTIQDLDDEDLAAYFDVGAGKGVLVIGVDEESAAEEAGVKAGDVIVRLDSEDIESTEDLIETVQEYEEGDEFDLVVIRRGKEKTLKGEMKEGEKFKWFGKTHIDLPHKGTWKKSFYLDEDDLEKIKGKSGEIHYRLQEGKDDLRQELQKLKEELKKLKERLEELEED